MVITTTVIGLFSADVTIDIIVGTISFKQLTGFSVMAFWNSAFEEVF